MLDRWPEDGGGEDDLGAELSFQSSTSEWKHEEGWLRSGVRLIGHLDKVPTPAAAASPPSSFLNPRQGTSATAERLSVSFSALSIGVAGKKQGLLRVDTPNGRFFIYHSRNSSGSFGTTSKARHALQVEYDVGPSPHRIMLRVSGDCYQVWTLLIFPVAPMYCGNHLVCSIGLILLNDEKIRTWMTAYGWPLSGTPLLLWDLATQSTVSAE